MKGELYFMEEISYVEVDKVLKKFCLFLVCDGGDYEFIEVI